LGFELGGLVKNKGYEVTKNDSLLKNMYENGINGVG
jgi:hypothetical protein